MAGVNFIAATTPSVSKLTSPLSGETRFRAVSSHKTCHFTTLSPLKGEKPALPAEGSAWRQSSINCHIFHRENEFVHCHNNFEHLLIYSQ